MTNSPPKDKPTLHILKGNATEEDIAAFVVALGALSGGSASARKPPPSWAAHHRKARVTYRRGLGGWRSSGQSR